MNAKNNDSNEKMSVDGKNIRRSGIMIRNIAVSAVFLALALAVKLMTSFYIPVLGANGIKVGFAGIFTAFPAILFGPVYGGAVSAMSDFLGAVIAPSGAYIPWLTVTAFCGGFIKGVIWKLVRERSEKNMRVVLAALFAAFAVYGVTTHVLVNTDGAVNGFFPTEENVSERETLTAKREGGELSVFTSAALELTKYSSDKAFKKNFAKNAAFLSLGCELFGLIGAAALIAEFFLSKKIKGGAALLKILTSTLTSGLFVTTVNTVILMKYIEAWNGRAFTVLLVPRVIEEVIVVIIQGCVIAVLYDVYDKRIAKKFRRV